MSDEVQNETARLRPCPSYHALWHLAYIGVVKPKPATKATGQIHQDIMIGDSPIWDQINAARPTEPTRVAILDNSVDWNHPNLKEAIDKDRMIDFTSAPLGAFANNIANAVNWAGIGTAAAISDAFDNTHIVGSLFDALKARLQARSAISPATPPTKYDIQAAISPRFSAHGTAIAGLIGARPAITERTPQAEATAMAATRKPFSVPVPEIKKENHPYAGVDPFCEMVPISMSFDDDPEQFILGLLYAFMIKADVIVLPRDFPDREKSPPHIALDIDAANEEKYEALNTLIIELSKKIPIVCAAGNDRMAKVIYPARLSAGNNGIISVGPHTWTGHASGFAPLNDRSVGSPIDIYAPSGDGEVLEEDEVRLDFTAPAIDEHYYDEETIEKAKLAPVFSPQQIVTTDVSGNYGYNFRSPDVADDPNDFGRNYTTFSGTSAASAIVAGMISLGISSGRWGGQNGMKIKQDIINNAVVANGIRKLHWPS